MTREMKNKRKRTLRLVNKKESDLLLIGHLLHAR